MKLGVMPGDTIPAPELKSEGFDAMQLFWGMGENAASKDPSVESIDATLKAGDLALSAMTLHIDLVGPRGVIEADVERTVHCVERTAALDGRYGDTPRPILAWSSSRTTPAPSSGRASAMPRSAGPIGPPASGCSSPTPTRGSTRSSPERRWPSPSSGGRIC